MKNKKDDFSSLPVDLAGSTYNLICYKSEPTVGASVAALLNQK